MYTEVAPSADLRPFVRAFWWRRAAAGFEAIEPIAAFAAEGEGGLIQKVRFWGRPQNADSKAAPRRRRAGNGAAR